MENNNNDNIPVIFTGPAVFTITEKIDNSVLEKFTKLYNEMLCGDVTGIRVYLASCGGDINCVNIMTDMINMSRYNIAIVASGKLANEALLLFLNTTCTSIVLPGTYASFYIGKEDCKYNQFKNFTKKYNVSKKIVQEFVNELRLGNEYAFKIAEDTFIKKIAPIRRSFDPNESDLEEALSELEMITLGNKADELGFLEDDADLTDKEFEDRILNSAYGSYSKKELEDFKEVLIQKGLYHRIKIVDKLLKNMK
jgi:hypothetical protein